MRTPNVQTASFVVLVLLVSTGFLWLTLPFYGAVLWAVILAILFNPLNKRLLARLGGRRNTAAALTLLTCICIVVIPGSLMLASLAREAANLYESIDKGKLDLAMILGQIRGALPSFLIEAFSSFSVATFEDLQSNLSAFLGQTAQLIATQAFAIGQNTVQFVVSLGAMLYLLFFLFRDGVELTASIRKASPLSPAHTDRVLANFADVVRATVQGNVVIAAIQGAIGGVTFWALGIQAALLWAVLMATLSLLPAVGAFLVWGPVAVYLLLSGDWTRGTILIGVGVLAISTIDNLLRPPLVGRGIRLPDYLVLLSTLGGIAVLGMNGFVIGPLVAALFITVWSLVSADQS